MKQQNIKQVIVVRNDLRSKLKSGKLGSQIAHASMAAFLMGMKITKRNNSTFHTLELEMEYARHEWISGTFTKIILKCDELDDLIKLNDKCSLESIPHALITDSGRTVFDEPTITCLGIGPLPEALLNPITGHLKLY